MFASRRRQRDARQGGVGRSRPRDPGEAVAARHADHPAGGGARGALAVLPGRLGDHRAGDRGGRRRGDVMTRGADLKPRHFGWHVDRRVATITLDRPERKNPLTFDSYAELTGTFLSLGDADDVRAVVLTGAGGNFCSGGDVHEIIGPLVAMRDRGDTEGLRAFHADDRRPGQGHARLPAADRRGRRRHLRRAPARSWRWPATSGSARRGARSASCSSGSACRAPTWARARCCRASSARGGPASSSTRGASWTGRRPNAGGSTIASSSPTAWLARPPRWRAPWPRDRPSRTP